MESVEIEVEDRTKPLDELEEGFSSSNFTDIVAPEDISQRFDTIDDKVSSYEVKKRASGFSAFGGITGTGSMALLLPFYPNLLTAGVATGTLSVTVAGNSMKEYLEGEIDDLEDEREELREMSENWYELPGVVDLSYLANQGLESQFERPYREWLDENISDWEDQALPEDLALQELDEHEGIDDSEDYDIDVSAFDYGVQRVYLEELDEELNEEVDGDHYKFVLQTYDEVEDGEINSYWGVTDERGRRIVEENDGVRKFSIDENEQLNRE
jgi:hypothetical protein